MDAAAGAEEMAGFLGDIVISVETAQRNARAENHSLETELRQLILHGALHLAGYDHATDKGEMNEIELRLRCSLEIEGLKERTVSRQDAKPRNSIRKRAVPLGNS